MLDFLSPTTTTVHFSAETGGTWTVPDLMWFFLMVRSEHNRFITRDDQLCIYYDGEEMDLIRDEEGPTLSTKTTFWSQKRCLLWGLVDQLLNPHLVNNNRYPPILPVISSKACYFFMVLFWQFPQAGSDGHSVTYVRYAWISLIKTTSIFPSIQPSTNDIHAIFCRQHKKSSFRFLLPHFGHSTIISCLSSYHLSISTYGFPNGIQLMAGHDYRLSLV